MNKEELKKLAADPNHIAGIYNYCDRWCERCSFTARCLNYKMSEEKFGDPETQDIDRSISAWGKVLEYFPWQKEKIIEIIAYLKRLCQMIEKDFPDARSFVRPGFDE